MIGPAVPAYLTPLSATLAHAGILHLAFNLLILVWCGTQVERVLGAKALIFIYVVSAYVAGVAEWLSPLTPRSQWSARAARSAESLAPSR